MAEDDQAFRDASCHPQPALAGLLLDVSGWWGFCSWCGHPKSWGRHPLGRIPTLGVHPERMDSSPKPCDLSLVCSTSAMPWVPFPMLGLSCLIFLGALAQYGAESVGFCPVLCLRCVALISSWGFLFLTSPADGLNAFVYVTKRWWRKIHLVFWGNSWQLL